VHARGWKNLEKVVLLFSLPSLYLFRPLSMSPQYKHELLRFIIKKKKIKRNKKRKK
jgi:c-di-GMP-binding flagellar brake protein YcgR